MRRLRYKLALIFLELGLKMIPNPWVRDRYDLAITAAAESILWEGTQNARQDSMAD